MTEAAAPRLTPLAPPNLDESQQALYDAITGGRRMAGRKPGGGLTYPDGSMMGPFNPYLYTPDVGSKLEQVGAALRFDTDLPRDLTELAIIIVGRHWSAEFEWYAHSRMAREAGIAEEVIDAIAHRRKPTFDRSDLADIHRFATEICETQHVSAATYAAARTHLSDRQIVELTMVIGYYHYVCAMLNVFEIALPAGATPLPA